MAFSTHEPTPMPISSSPTANCAPNSLTLAPSRPTFKPPHNLHNSLRQLSCKLVDAAVSSTPVYAAFLSTSIRNRFISTVRKRLYESTPDAFWQPEQDALYTDRAATALLKRLVDKMFDAPHRPICFAYDLLYETLHSLSPADPAFDILAAVWRDMLQPFRHHLFDWLVFAEVHDGEGQFFIEGNEPHLVLDRLPKIVTTDVAERILQAGRARGGAIQLAKGVSCLSVVLLGDEEDWEKKLLKNFLEDPVAAQLELDAASLRWRVAAAQRLSDLLPFHQIRRKVFLLRQYLLLGHASFWRSFFDELRAKALLLVSGEMEEAERKSAENAITQILVATVAEYEVDEAEGYNVRQPPLVLQVTSTGGILPRFTLTFAESQIIATKSSVYCDVFSIAFNVRRVACELRAALANLQWLDRRLRRARNFYGRQSATRCLVGVIELRRRMAIFVDGFEWYVQAEVLQPKFATLLGALDDYLEGKESRPSISSRKPFYDEILSLHEVLLDKVFAQCFVGHQQIDKRLTAIFAVCFSLCDFITELTIEGLQQNDFSDTLHELETNFERNVSLLVRLLLHLQHGTADPGIPALLVRINFNRYVKD